MNEIKFANHSVELNCQKLTGYGVMENCVIWLFYGCEIFILIFNFDTEVELCCVLGQLIEGKIVRETGLVDESRFSPLGYLSLEIDFLVALLRGWEWFFVGQR